MEVAGPESIRGEQSLPEGRSFFTRIWGSFAAIIFGIAILLLSLLAVSNPTAVLPNEITASNAAEMKNAVEVKYYLPYPGILPDSPLYRIKMVRDQISLALTFDPLKKAQKELLFADKRINAAVVLMDGGKKSLGVTTGTKAEKYLSQSAQDIVSIQRQGRDVKSQLLTLQIASAKHAQILQTMKDQLTGDDRVVIETTLKNTLMTAQNVEQALLDSK
jgi:hypothetical protein